MPLSFLLTHLRNLYRELSLGSDQIVTDTISRSYGNKELVSIRVVHVAFLHWKTIKLLEDIFCAGGNLVQSEDDSRHYDAAHVIT